MKVILVDGVFEVRGCYLIKDSRDDFIRNISTDNMLMRMLALDYDDEGKRKETLFDASSNFVGAIEDFCGGKLETVQYDVVPKDYFKNSAPGYIYLHESFENLRAFDSTKRILILLYDRTQNMHLDITISPSAFAYGMEQLDVNLGNIAWLVVEPGLANPLKVTPIDGNLRDYMHFLIYR